MGISARLYRRHLARHAQSLPLVQRADRPVAPSGPRVRLHEFVAEAWDKLPEHGDRPFVDNWHIRKMCDAMEGVYHGDTVDLAINIPPGHMKSLLVAVFFPAWVWTMAPEKQFLCATNSDALTKRDAIRMRDLVTSAWYRERWPHVRLRKDRNAIKDYANTSGGFRQSTSVESRITGARADFRIIDDALGAMDAKSATKRQACRDWYTTEFASRKNDEQSGDGVQESSTIVIGQRLHDDDLFGLFDALGGWDWVVLPSEYDPEIAAKNTLFEDPRQAAGELLFPERFDRDALKRARMILGDVDYAAQHTQTPMAEGGTIFQDKYWRFWRYSASEPVGIVELDRFVDRPNDFDVVMMSVDCSFKDTASSSYVVIQVWGGIGPDSYLLDQLRRQMGFVETIEALRTVYAMWPDIHAVLVEDKANGPAVIDTLSDAIAGVIPVEPKGGKEVRAHAVTYQITSGHVFLPNPATHDWMEEFLREHRRFPRYSTDDQVDALTQALLHLRRHSASIMMDILNGY